MINLREPRNVPEEAREMEHHHGYEDYEKCLDTGKLRKGDKIVIFYRLPKGNHLPITYTIESKRLLKAHEQKIMARRKLQGKNWFINISDANNPIYTSDTREFIRELEKIAESV